MWNSGENDEVTTPIAGEVQGVVPPLNGNDVQGVGAGDAQKPIEGDAPQLTPEEQRMVDDLRRYRNRLHDVTDERFEKLIQDLREARSARSLARELVEEGYCPQLAPRTVRAYVTGVRDALGLPGYVEQQEEIENATTDVEPDEPIEGQPAIKKLKWLSRIQQARVRKALRLEGMMGGMLLPQAASEMKLMSDLIDKELEVSLKTGEMKQVPQQVKLDLPEGLVTTQAEAYRVYLAYQRLKKLTPKILAEGTTTDDRPASDAVPSEPVRMEPSGSPDPAE